MNDNLTYGLTLFATLGCGVMAGLFFTFSVFMMRALDRLPGTQGMAVMQSINKTIITPLFVLAFLGSALACIALVTRALFGLGGEPEQVYLVAGGFLYLLGAFALTIRYHVPRNNALDAADPQSPEAAEHWARYMAEWTRWNHVRTVASLGAMAALIVAIRVG